MTTRNFWGWGYEEAALGEQQAAPYRQLLGMQFGAVPEIFIKAPSVAELDMPAARVTPPPALAGLCSSDPRERAGHTYGKAFRDIVRGLAGDFRVAPDLVARPADEGQLASLLDWAQDARLAVIPYGGGSTVTGGVEPRLEGDWQGSLCVDMAGFSKVLDMDHQSRAAHIQAGIYGPALEDILRPQGLTLRHYPQSFEFSTLGGWIATRSGGHFATLHTHIDEFVESLRVLTPRGMMETRRLPGSGAGPQPERLFIGSEGILGFITSAWMRLQQRPVFRAFASVRFADFMAGAEAARLLAQSALYPSNCRLIHAQEALINGAGDGRSHLLLVAFESADHPLHAWMARALEIVRDCGGEIADEAVRFPDDTSKPQTTDQDAGSDWRRSFVRAPYVRDMLVRMGMVTETFETAVTWDRFAHFHEQVMTEVGNEVRRLCGQCIMTCRVTHVYADGLAPYYTIIAPGRQGEQLEIWDDIKAIANAVLVREGGTITHHHSVGRDHMSGYQRERPALFAEALGAMKQTLDPGGVLNPGILLPEAN